MAAPRKAVRTTESFGYSTPNTASSSSASRRASASGKSGGPEAEGGVTAATNSTRA